MSTDGFHWDDEDVVLQEQPRTAVFLNEDQAVVVRQQNWPEDDSTVLIQPQNAIRFVLAVLAAAGHHDIELVRSFGGGGFEDVEIPSKPPPRPRERQESGFIDAVRTERPDFFDQKMGPKDHTAPAVAKSIRAAEAIKANPGKSDRAIAADIGVSHPTVAKARSELGGNNLPPERTGQDGKSYSVRQRVTDDPPLLPEFDLQNGGPRQTALTN